MFAAGAQGKSQPQQAQALSHIYNKKIQALNHGNIKSIECISTKQPGGAKSAQPYSVPQSNA